MKGQHITVAAAFSAFFAAAQSASIDVNDVEMCGASCVGHPAVVEYRPV
ncbi:hypothetical protein LOF13_07265 [Klebsiella pneumoniae subsp. pneumoniae]|nr:hypothetical protein [Klebsiella pneumoniae]UNA34239.1 hypothetical protein LOF13_07265 [Klebsiella pneumoniae subsp. pneumoniae]